MKKILLLIIVFAFIGTNAYSQFSFGGKIGGATTILTGVGLENFVPDSKIKFVGGGIINYSFGQRIALQTEVLYQSKGAGFSYYNEIDAGRYLIKMEQKLGYLSIPLMLQLKMGDRYNYFHFDAGLISNSLIHSKYEGTMQAEKSNGDLLDPLDYPINQTPTHFDLGYAFGIGLVANGLNFDFRMEFGTKKVYQETDGNAPNVLNKSFQVSVGYTLTY